MEDIRASFKLAWPDFSLDVDLTLPGRGVSALFGASGSGKTTLLRCIAGLERAPHGQLQVAGEVWQNANQWLPTHKRPLGYVFQESSLFPHLTVLGNLRYGMRRSPLANVAALDQAVELLGIAHLLERAPEHLSGGERQRVGIARALAVGPKILLMDEPLAALDLKRKQEILPYLERLHDALEIPVIYVSHAADEVARLADHLVLLDQGRAVARGPLADTLTRLDVPIRLGEDLGAMLEATLGEIDPRWHLARVDFNGGSLWVRDHGIAIGRKVRVRVLARDISLALQQPQQSSIQNTLPGIVDGITDDAHPSQVLVRIRLGQSLLLAQVTKRAADALALHIGQALWVQVKSVALME